MRDLVAQAIEQTGGERREEPISVLIFENAGEIPIVLLNPEGRVMEGDFSDAPVKEFGFHHAEGAESRIVFLPGFKTGEMRETDAEER